MMSGANTILGSKVYVKVASRSPTASKKKPKRKSETEIIKIVREGCGKLAGGVMWPPPRVR